MVHKYNIYFAMIFEKEELDHRQVVEKLFCTYILIAYLLHR